MNNTKEKSAVGIAVPATEKDINNLPENIISENEGKIKKKIMPETIKAVIQRPGEISEIVEIEDKFFRIKELIGGVPGCYIIPEIGLEMIYVVDGLFLPYNIYLKDDIINGSVLITNSEKDELVSLTPEQIQAAREWLLKHTYEEEKQ